MLACCRSLGAAQPELSVLVRIGVSRASCCGLTGAKTAALHTCDPVTNTLVSGREAPQTVEEGEEVIFTYDVLFRVRCARTD